MTVEDDVRRMLERRAGDVAAAADGWDRIEQRLGEQPSTPSVARSPRRALILVAAAVIAVGGLVLAIRPERVEQVVATGSAQTGDGGPSEAPATTSLEPPTTFAPLELPTTAALPVEPPASAPPTTVSSSPPPGVPRLVSATAAITERQGTYAQGTITVTFDRPVELAGADTLIAMRLVVFTADAGCFMPNGNSHRVISGNGTPTLTLDASSLNTTTTYVRIVGGFVRSVESGIENTPTDCIAVPTTG